MKIHFTQGSPDTGEWGSRECDTYKYETHPVTGNITLFLYESKGQQNFLVAAVAGVRQFAVGRP